MVGERGKGKEGMDTKNWKGWGERVKHCRDGNGKDCEKQR
jgi:hypothetical protein